MIPWWRPEFGENEAEAVAHVVRSAYVNEGEVVNLFEQRLRLMLGTRYAVATTSGTAALFLALGALGVGAGDEVLVPDLTFYATASAVVLTGARPVLVDVEPETLTVDPESARRALTRKTRAVVPVHVSGRGGSIEEVVALARGEGIAVVEDAAEALLSRRGLVALGALGDAGCYSFSPNKTVTTGQGGLVVTDREDVYWRLRELKDQGRKHRGTGGGEDVHDAVGFNFKLTDLQAAVGIHQLDRLASRAEAQRRVRRDYGELLRHSCVRLPPFLPEEVPQWTDALSGERDALVAHLATVEIECRRYWRPLHEHGPFRSDPARFPVATDAARRGFWLPSSFALSRAEVELICDEVRRFQ